jgi:predicted transcriptional regulator
MSNLAERLLKLKKRVDDTKESLARHKGKREELMRRLEDEHGIKSEEEARRLLRKLRKETEKLEEELEERVAEIEKEVEGMEG